MNEFKDYALIDVEFTKIDWELTGDNISERSEEGEWIDIDGIVCVESLTEDGDFEYAVIVDDVLEGNLFEAMEVVAEFEDSGDYDEFNIYYATKCEVLSKEGDNDEREIWEHRWNVGHVLCSQMGTDENFNDYDLDVPALCRVKWPSGYVGVWKTDAEGNFVEPIEESLFEEILTARK